MTAAVKVCGITRVEDGIACARLGVRAIGLMLFEGSARYVTPEAAGAIARALPPFVTAVGVFVNPEAAAVRHSLDAAPIDLLQFHGEESPEFCRQFGRPYVKAARVRPGGDLIQYAARYGDARALLLDAFVEGQHGGTGMVFDWNLIPGDLQLPVILSGGLTSQNVAAAIRRVRPWAVDVSSGVERAKGIKDRQLIAAFMQEVGTADV